MIVNTYLLEHSKPLPQSGDGIKATHHRLIKVLDKEIEWVTTEFSIASGEVTEWQRLYESSVLSLVLVMAWPTLMGELTELGSRRIRGGRAPIRTVLYMAMMSAIQHNPVMKRFYRSLVNNDKHKKVALTACMRKMVKILNAMVRDDCLWQEA